MTCESVLSNTVCADRNDENVIAKSRNESETTACYGATYICLSQLLMSCKYLACCNGPVFIFPTAKHDYILCRKRFFRREGKKFRAGHVSNVAHTAEKKTDTTECWMMATDFFLPPRSQRTPRQEFQHSLSQSDLLWLRKENVHLCKAQPCR